jgi:hypothetical protein
MLSSHCKNKIHEVMRKRITYLTRGKLAKICKYLDRLSSSNNYGQIIETGCALGGSAILMACCKRRDLPLRVYDTFEMMPPPSRHDGSDVHIRYETILKGGAKGFGNDTYYGYIPNLYEKVRENFLTFGINLSNNNVELIQGLIENTLNLTTPVVLAHVDVDWYDPVKISIDRIWPMLTRKGVMIFDDYFTYSGCRKAVDSFFNSIGGIKKDGSCGSLAIIKE